MDIRMGEPTLNTWEIIMVGYLVLRSWKASQGRLAVGAYAPRSPQAFGREDNQNGFQVL
jgi:hypothetical protein